VFSKVRTIYKIAPYFRVLFLWMLVISYLISCSSLDLRPLSSVGTASQEQKAIENTLSIPSLIHDTSRIRSVQLFRGTPAGVPVITLGSSETLTLNFDEIAEQVNMFSVSLSHHNADWTESNLIPAFFMGGFMEDVIQGGTPNMLGYPSFFSYTYRFPNRDFSVRASGNYQLHIHDYASREILFTLPFIVQEDRGSLSVRVEDFFDFRATPKHQIFANYVHPEFIRMPQSDLKFVFTQNQFWGRSVTATEADVSTPGQITRHQTREQSFPARYEFRTLWMDDIQTTTRDIIEVRPDARPPLVRLQFDVVDLDINPRFSRSYRFGEPSTSRNARYADVEFNLQRPEWIRRNAEIFVTGSFVNWQIQEEFRMEYIHDEDAFRSTGLIKEGRYDYKYVLIENNTVDVFPLSAFFADTRQFYQVIIYYHDLQQGYDRVLQFINFEHR